MFEFNINSIEDWQSAAQYTEDQVDAFHVALKEEILNSDNIEIEHACDGENGAGYNVVDSYYVLCCNEFSFKVTGKITANDEDAASVADDLKDMLADHFWGTDLRFKIIATDHNEYCLTIDDSDANIKEVVS